MPEILKGLTMRDYAHPDDIKTTESLMKSKAVEKLFEAVEDKYYYPIKRMEALGGCVKVTKENAPRLCTMVEEVCEILDHDKIPEVYTRRECKLQIYINGDEQPMLIVPDLVVNRLDDDMLRFHLGRSISRLKSEHIKLLYATKAVIEVSGLVEGLQTLTKLGFADWMRKSDLTADRGGLLACQNINAAIRFLMYKAGMPPEETKKVKIHDYIEACRIENKVSRISKSVDAIDNIEPWTNDRIAELFLWYTQGGYGDILDKYAE